MLPLPRKHRLALALSCALAGPAVAASAAVADGGTLVAAQGSQEPAALFSPEAVAERLTEATSALQPGSAADAQALQAAVEPPAAKPAGPAVPVDGDLVPRLRPSLTIPALRPPPGEPLPVFLSADRIVGSNEDTVATGDVELRRLGLVVNADQMTYRPAEETVDAEGHLRVTQAEGEVRGERMRLRLTDLVGTLDKPTYAFRRDALPGAEATPGKGPGGQAHGHADILHFEGENQYRMDVATFSTCQPGDDSWYLRVSDLQLDYDREVGDAFNATVIFKGVPIFYSPWINFPLNNQRKSGFLPPTLGSTNISGTEITVPYYFNIAPDKDLTLAPRFFTKRGTQLNTEARYLGESYNGQARLEWLPDDRVRQLDRWGYSLQHSQTFGAGFSGALNLNGVSDDFYYKDLSSRISSSAQTQLLRQGTLSYGQSGWFAAAQVLRYQTLQPDPLNPVAPPYFLEPRLEASTRQEMLDTFDGVLFYQYTNFRHPDPAQISGHRTVLYPQLALPVVEPSGFFTPKFGVHFTRYSFEDQPVALRETYQRSVPIFSVDSGLNFERDLRWFGRDLVQTLEPRLYYLYVPLRDQSFLTTNGVNFDSGIADFNFAQIFAENLFTGQDRIADANQFTAAVTSRFLDAEDGGERLKLSLGQRFYLDSQEVTLNSGDARRTDRKTDILAAASGRLSAETWLDSAVQYNPRDGRLERFNVGARYQPGLGRVVNVAYRFGRNQTAPFDVAIEQVDVSGQWPLFGGWQAVGRYNYSLNENRAIETIAGLEYRAGCWAVRAVAQRYATTATEATSAMFLQLELSDFSRIGSNPLELLKRSIPGYGRVDQPAADPVFGTQK